MAYIVGLVLAVLVSLFARRAGFDRDRAFYPTVLIVVASYYVLFAVMGGSTQALVADTLIMIGFVVAAGLGFRLNLWMVVAGGLAAHGVLDLVHDRVVFNAGVPAWWPPFCSAYDVTAAVCLAWLSRRPGLERREQI